MPFNPTNWVPVTNLVNSVGPNNEVMLPVTAGGYFFRLTRPCPVLDETRTQGLRPGATGAIGLQRTDADTQAETQRAGLVRNITSFRRRKAGVHGGSK
jgi:hypothetical protein